MQKGANVDKNSSNKPARLSELHIEIYNIDIEKYRYQRVRQFQSCDLQWLMSRMRRFQTYDQERV